MEFRNPHYNRQGSIDCEVNHPRFGWIPFTASHGDPDPSSAGIYAAIMEGEGPIAPYEPGADPAPVLTDYQSAITAHLDDTAKARQYDGALSIVSYMGSTNPQWAAEAVAFAVWRDEVWAYAYGQLALVEAGQLTPPNVQDFIAELPMVGWPT